MPSKFNFMFKALCMMIVSTCLTLSINPPAYARSQAEDIDSMAREFVDLLVKEEFESATGLFDQTMKNAMPVEKLQQTWTGLLGQVGRFKKQIGTRDQKVQQYDIIFVTCEFEQATLDVKVVFDSAKKIAGLFFLPSQQTFTYDAPDYAKSDVYTEKEVVVGTGKWSLPGTLTVPRGKGPFPAVILVHGSGPQDRDETIGPNKPFRDLAWGLATRGVAVLRYEKRTKQYTAEMANMKDKITVEEETIADVLEAVSLLLNTPEVDIKRIIVAGHSLGGMLIPKIGLRDERISGYIILAGTTRPMEDVIYEQFEYIFNLDDRLTEDEQKQLEELRNQVKTAKSAELSEKTPSSLLPLGIPATYWLDLRDYDPAKEATKLKKPLLILQGERDYQVTMKDYKRWQESLASHDNVQMKLFPSLNHLFMQGEGKSGPSEYEKPAHVNLSVIDTIVEWIRGLGDE